MAKKIEINPEAVDCIVNILYQRYDCSFEPAEDPNELYVMGPYGDDCGIVKSNGDYYYELNHYINAFEQPEEEVFEVLDKFFNNLVG